MSLSKVNLTKLGRAQRRDSQEQHAQKNNFCLHRYSMEHRSYPLFLSWNYTSKKIENFANSFGGCLKACGGLRRQTTIGLSMLFKYFFTVQTCAQIIPRLSSRPPIFTLVKEGKRRKNDVAGKSVDKWRTCDKMGIQCGKHGLRNICAGSLKLAKANHRLSNKSVWGNKFFLTIICVIERLKMGWSSQLLC